MEKRFETDNLYDDTVLEEIIATGQRVKDLMNQKYPTPLSENEYVSLAVTEFKTYVSILPLTPDQKEKLNQMISGFDESIATAKEVDPNFKIISLKEVTKAFLELGLDTIKEIAQFGQPTLIITPNNSFAEKIANMDQHKKFVNAKGKTQENTNFMKGADQPFIKIGTPIKNIISIVDGQPNMPHIPGIAPNSRFDQRKVAFKKHYAKTGMMRLINIHESAVLQQLSLRAHTSKNQDVKKIVDYHLNKNNTISCLDDEYLTSSLYVASSYFDATNRNVMFRGEEPDLNVACLRARPSVPFLEY